MMKTIIFDIDGTIFDTKVGIIACLNDVLQHHGRGMIPAGEEDKYIGPPIKDSLIKFNRFEESEAVEATREYREQYVAKYVVNSVPYDGLVDLLYLIKEKGYKLCIATMKTSGQVEKLLNYFEIADLFDVVETAKDEGGYTKAEMLESIKKQYTDGSMVFVGDTNGDYKAAVKADIPFVYARYGYGVIEGYRGLQIDSLLDLKDFVAV